MEWKIGCKSCNLVFTIDKTPIVSKELPDGFIRLRCIYCKIENNYEARDVLLACELPFPTPPSISTIDSDS